MTKDNVKCQKGEITSEQESERLMTISRLNITVKQFHLEVPNLEFMIEK
jgi:hypothetical protein